MSEIPYWLSLWTLTQCLGKEEFFQKGGPRDCGKEKGAEATSKLNGPQSKELDQQWEVLLQLVPHLTTRRVGFSPTTSSQSRKGWEIQRLGK
jgi:hypothetical protein